MTDHLPECINCRKVMTAQREEAAALRKAMSGHLPECPGNVPLAICICDRLRACEARVLSNWLLAEPINLANARAEALDAAREAVAALEGMSEISYDYPAYSMKEILAAIDALRATP